MGLDPYGNSHGSSYGSLVPPWESHDYLYILNIVSKIMYFIYFAKITIFYLKYRSFIIGIYILLYLIYNYLVKKGINQR